MGASRFSRGLPGDLRRRAVRQDSGSTHSGVVGYGLMDIFHNLAIGFNAALTFANIGFCLLGVILGTLIGVLPGIGPLATIAMLLPITFDLNALSSLIML